MNSYFIIAGLFWAGAFSLYFLFLRSRTFHNLNRGYLLITLFAGMILPFIQLPALAVEPHIGYLQPVVITLNGITEEIATSPPASDKNWLWDMVFIFYITGIVFFLIRIVLGLLKIKRLANNCKKEKHGTVNLLITEKELEPFSFFNTVFINAADRDNPAILNHEIAHVSGKHSWDIIFTQVFAAIHWFNPILWLYDKALKETHEYIADNRVLQHTPKKEYSYMLLGQASPFFQPQLSNSFHSQTKKRIKMMFRKKSKAYAYVFYPIAVLVVLRLSSFLLVSCQKPSNEAAVDSEKNKVEVLTQIDTVITFDAETFEESTEIIKSETEIYKVVEQMPLFPGCDDVSGSHMEKKTCADNKLLKFIQSNIKYPEIARKNGIQGRCFITFIVEKDGSVTNAELVRDIGGQCGQESLRVVNLMTKNGIKWTPGKQDGRSVRVQFNLPVHFKLK